VNLQGTTEQPISDLIKMRMGESDGVHSQSHRSTFAENILGKISLIIYRHIDVGLWMYPVVVVVQMRRGLSIYLGNAC
jgi:hypothetical protein